MRSAAWDALSRPRIVLGVLMPGAFAAFLGGIAIAAVPYYAGKPFDWKDAIISFIESPQDNPHGYVAAAIGIALCGALLLPAVSLIHRRLRLFHRRLAWFGSAVLRGGLWAAVAIGCLAPFPGTWTIHVALAYITYIGLAAGTFICLTLAVQPVLGKSRRAGLGLLLLALLNFGCLAYTVFLLLGPADYFNNQTLLKSLAACEWTMSVTIAVSSYVLAAVLVRCISE